MRTVHLISFGYLHLNGGPPPQADRVEDVRDRLRDPAAAAHILDLDGRDPQVQHVVENTRRARPLLDNLVAYVLMCEPSRIAIGCAGGKHRAGALVELLARRLNGHDCEVEIEHQHIHLPRVLGDVYRGPEYTDRDGHGWRPMSDEPRFWWAPQHPIPLTFDELREQRGPLTEVQR